MPDLATLTFDGPIAELTLNRPDSRNALSPDLLAALHDRAGELAARPDVTVLRLTGAGKAFCAGMDLKLVLGDAPLAEQLLTSLADLTLKLRLLPMVLVAVVNGPAIGGGCGLVTVCDLAITFADNKMGFPEVDLGVCPAVVAPWLVRKIGFGPARRVLLSGGLMSGAQAHDLGIVSALVPTHAELQPAAATLVERLASGGPHALRATKSLLNDIDGSRDHAVLREAAALSARVLNTPETQSTLRRKLNL